MHRLGRAMSLGIGTDLVVCGFFFFALFVFLWAIYSFSIL